jgi:hypothetical protein
MRIHWSTHVAKILYLIDQYLSGIQKIGTPNTLANQSEAQEFALDLFTQAR